MAGITVAMIELLVVCCFYGTRRLFSNVLTMTSARTAGQVVSPIDYYLQMLTSIMLYGVIPVSVGVAFTFYVTAESTSFSAIDVALIIFILCPIPLCALYRLWYYTTHKMDWKRLFQPDVELWGPRSSNNRELAEKNEKLFRL
ncbi:hypothetical protein Q1695_010111 [Nippostrongylus brasiliensis]|nr:hypothetical protein Q1695_010111 [Nippostrongylus brasiliensis]